MRNAPRVAKAISAAKAAVELQAAEIWAEKVETKATWHQEKTEFLKVWWKKPRGFGGFSCFQVVGGLWSFFRQQAVGTFLRKTTQGVFEVAFF